MTVLLALLLCPAAFSQPESASPLAAELVARARTVAAEDYTGEKGDVTKEEARRPPKQVSDAVWRSSRLDEVGLERLYELGIRTIVNLEGPDEQRLEAESLARIERRRAAQGLPDWRIESLNVPMSGIWRPKFAQVDRALAILSDPAKAPALVHCKHGEDRTGVVIASYRTDIERKLTVAQAVAEAKSMNCCHLVLPGRDDLEEFLVKYGRHRGR